MMLQLKAFAIQKLIMFENKKINCKKNSFFCLPTMTKDGDNAEVMNRTPNIGASIFINKPASDHSLPKIIEQIGVAQVYRIRTIIIEIANNNPNVRLNAC